MAAPKKTIRLIHWNEAEARSRAQALERAGYRVVNESSALKSDLSETHVRTAALGAGMVDFKVCAVDATWSGLRFTLKNAGR